MNTVDIDGVDWSEEGRRYDRVHHRLKRVAGIVNRLPNVSSVFDIGCGSGKLASLLKPHVSYYGCDIVPALIDGHDPTHYALWNIGDGQTTDLPFQTRRMDCLVLSGILEHVDDQTLVVGKLRQIAAPCGYIILTYASPDFVLYRFGIAVRPNDANWIKRLLNQEQVLTLFEENDFELCQLSHLSYFLYYPPIPIVDRMLHWVTNQYIYVFRSRC